MDLMSTYFPKSAGKTEIDIEDLLNFLERRVDYGVGGRVLDVEEGSYYGSDEVHATVDLSNRQRLDHYGNGGEGWDDEGWWNNYAGPVTRTVQKQIDKRFGKGLLSVDVGEKGRVTVQPTRKSKVVGKRFGTLAPENLEQLIQESGGDTESYMSVQALRSMKSHSEGLLKLIDENTPLPDWVEYKLAQSSGMLTSIYEYMVHGVLKKAGSSVEVLIGELEGLFGEKTEYLNGKVDFLNSTDDLFEIFITGDLQIKLFINKHLYLSEDFSNVEDAFQSIVSATNPHM